MATAIKNSGTLLSAIFKHRKYSDLTIKCQGKVFEVHRSVVCLQSDVFARMIDGSFKEASTGIIDLPENEPAVVETMIEFLYTHSYSDGHEQTDCKWDNVDSGPLIMNLKMYVIGEQYNIQCLKQYAARKYEDIVGKHWNSVSFVASLHMMYECTPESDRVLKDIAIAVAGNNMRSLCDREDFVKLCKEVNEIAVEVMKYSFTKNRLLKPCNQCGKRSHVLVREGFDFNHHCDHCDQNF